MDPIRLIVVLVVFAGVGVYAFLAANAERAVDAGSAVGFLNEDGLPAGQLSAASASTSLDAGATVVAVSDQGDAEIERAGFPDPNDKVEKSDDEWRRLLTDDQFYVLRKSGTERPFSSPLDDIKRPGWFTCAGCDNLLFETKTKFDSRTGWPSFWEPVAASHVVEEVEGGFDRRIEVRCARCDGHLGHVFRDGPRDQTGLRYCMNGVAMNFTPKAGESAK